MYIVTSKLVLVTGARDSNPEEVMRNFLKTMGRPQRNITVAHDGSITFASFFHEFFHVTEEQLIQSLKDLAYSPVTVFRCEGMVDPNRDNPNSRLSGMHITYNNSTIKLGRQGYPCSYQPVDVFIQGGEK